MFINLIQNVDISCCGVSWDGKNLHQNYPNAIVHCQNKVFSINAVAKMYSTKRIQHRRAKFEERGWIQIDDDHKWVNREQKIDNILNVVNPIEFISEVQRHPNEYGEPLF